MFKILLTGQIFNHSSLTFFPFVFIFISLSSLYVYLSYWNTFSLGSHLLYCFPFSSYLSPSSYVTLEIPSLTSKALRTCLCKFHIFFSLFNLMTFVLEQVDGLNLVLLSYATWLADSTVIQRHLHSLTSFQICVVSSILQLLNTFSREIHQHLCVRNPACQVKSILFLNTVCLCLHSNCDFTCFTS